MYGSVAHLRTKEGQGDALLEVFEQQSATYFAISGAIALYCVRLDADPRNFIMVTIFDSRETYFANAKSAAQHERDLVIRKLLETDPAWHDGEVEIQMGSKARFEDARYGTVAHLSLNQPAGPELEAFVRRSDSYEDELPGGVVNYTYTLDSDPRNLILFVAWQSRELYHANARSPGQDKRYRELRTFLTADPIWHDGEIFPFHRF